ncbi:MAG: hypothetical protein RUDDFDWM_000654 [Candidatus Fervidibacterota bacterium]
MHFLRRLRFYSLMPFILLLQDALMALIGFVLAYHMRFFWAVSKWFPPHLGIPPIGIHAGFIMLHVIAWLICLNMVGLYKRHRDRYAVDEFYSVLICGLLASAIVGTLATLLRYQWLSRLVFIMAEAFTTLLISFGRVCMRAVERMLNRAGIGLVRVVVIGSDANQFAKQICELEKNCKVVGTLELGEQSKGDGFVSADELIKHLSSMGEFDEVIVQAGSLNEDVLLQLLNWADGKRINVRLMLSLVDVIKRRGQFEELAGMPSVIVARLPLRTWGAFVKRIMDIFLSLFLLVLFSLPMLIIALLIKLTSKGPVLYRQERVGQDGKVFVMLKFRTMYEGAEDETGPVWAKPNDPRCTPVGRVLRRLSLDELPQLFNVLKGDMSLVGPRPERPYFVEQFAEHIPRYMERHRVKSGITGWAQVNGLRGNCSIEERTKYDLYYVENWSLLLDLKILIKTAFEVFFHKQAY